MAIEASMRDAVAATTRIRNMGEFLQASTPTITLDRSVWNRLDFGQAGAGCGGQAGMNFIAAPFMQ
jgi:hypothetical protein